MKLFVYSYREFDEADYFQQAAEEYGIEIAFTAEEPSMENADFAEGYPYVSIITTKIDEELLKKFADDWLRPYRCGSGKTDWISHQSCNVFSGMRGRLYVDADVNVYPQNETDHAA